MAMEINNNYGNYAAGGTKEDSIITSTVELKTSTPGKTKTEQIKTGYSNVKDYSQYLQEKYAYMNTGTTSMQGVPTTVSVSSAFLKKCMNDPEKAKYLEENLAAIPDCVKSLTNYTKMMPGSPVVTYAAYQIDGNGNISMMSGCTNDPDGRIARENAERKAKEQKEKQERLEKKRAEQKEQEKRLAQMRAERKAESEALQSREVTVVGNDVRDMTEKSIQAVSNPNTPHISVSGTVGVDIKA